MKTKNAENNNYQAYICFRGIKYATYAVLLSFSVRRFHKGPSQSLYDKDDDDDS